MNLFGIGVWELIAILLIMLVIAGPKRMLIWSRILGQYVARFRRIWSETVDLVQQEFDAAGIDLQLPKQPPTRQSLNRALSDAVAPVTAPLQSSLNEVQQDLDVVHALNKDLQGSAQTRRLMPPAANTAPPQAAAPQASTAAKPARPQAETALMGSWSRQPQPSAHNGKLGNADLGAWSRFDHEALD